MARLLARISLATAAFLVAAPLAHAGSINVANSGVDGAGCGSTASPCRSIGQGIARAMPGDSVIVGPGRYGDLNRNGVLGEPGEENPNTLSPGCGCMLGINKSVSVTSSAGAAATEIDARSVGSNGNVLIIANGVQFGKPGKGFTVTGSSGAGRNGITIDASNVKVMGNQVIALVTNEGRGIFPISNDGEEVLIQGNQVIGFGTGIFAEGQGKTVRKNQLSFNGYGIFAGSGSIVLGNVVTGNFIGVGLQGAPLVTNNAIYGNSYIGLTTVTGYNGGAIEGNDIVGNGTENAGPSHQSNCGLENGSPLLVMATRNYWGAATGPGSNPADDVCRNPPSAGSISASPFATQPFTVKAPIKP